MKFFALRLFLFAILTLSASLATFADTLIGEAVAVTDGDTIVVYDSHQHRKVRLNGIDAPESDQEFGQASKQTLSDWVLGKRVAVVWNKTDHYDLILGTVIIGLVDVGLEQVRIMWTLTSLRSVKVHIIQVELSAPRSISTPRL